ncbi:hypothetical protein CL634_08450 [bacterium]|nr:hypothetical protein [bacterium]|tara:strand:+ start:71 stop:442 length:372 start_codon:yes stop_codon:yes gene_type:complete
MQNRAVETRVCGQCGQPIQDNKPATYGPFSVWLAKNKAWYKNEEIKLSPQQLGLYELLVKRQGKIVPYWYAENELAGIRKNTPNHLKVVMCALRKRVGEHAAIEAVYGQGYKLVIVDDKSSRK